MKHHLLTFAKSLLRMAVVVYALTAAALYFLQDQLLFYPRATSADIARQHQNHAVTFERDGVALQGWFIRANQANAATIVFYGGNAEEMSRSIDGLRRIGTEFNYLLVNYRGYGASGGEPSEHALEDDAVFVLRALAASGDIELDRTVLFGRSLGTAIAIHAAAALEVGALVLVVPFDSIEDVAAAHYALFPVRPLIRHRFRAIDDAVRVREPTLILKAARDRVIPHQHTDALIRAWTGGRLTTATVPNSTHNHIFTEDLYAMVRGFIAGNLASRASLPEN